jgi:LPS export ABC transporter protein LptC
MIRITFLFIGIVALLLFYSCANDLGEVKRLTEEIVLPVSSTKNVEMTYSDSARLRAKIKAPLRETYVGEKSEVVFNKGINIEFFDSAGKLESKMRANYAISYTKEDRLEARNNVVVENTSGDKLETEHLIWEQKEDRIHSDVFTKITSPDRVIFGDGFESNQDFSRYRILKVRGVIDLKD